MSGKSMDVFALRDSVVDEYRKFATSFTTIHAPDIRTQVEAIYAEGRFWPDPLLQINPSFQRGLDLETLISSGALDPRTAEIFRADGAPLSLYKHQEHAVDLAKQGHSYVVTTGTGSGKSLCFFIPIVSAVLAEKRTSAVKRTRAIIIYPMNALANSQREELEKYLGNVEGKPPITFARYTGQEDGEERRRIADNPPDILLTNFMMLELLMTRQDELDQKVIGNCAGLRFLVLDELHTYRGRQGADVALLVRRVRERLAGEHPPQCIGTSATMVSDGSAQDKQAVVAAVASKLFSSRVDPSHVIIEKLERVTDGSKRAESVRAALGPAIDAGVPVDITNEDLRTHPLAIWTETRLGITTTEQNPAWHRARPRTLDEAARELSQDAGRDEDACREALRVLLLVSSLPERDRGESSASASTRSDRSFFAFKLHQFVSGAGHAFSTLERAGERTVTVEGQQFLPNAPEKRLYPVHFCRECGHEYHPVRLVTEDGMQRVRARDIDDAAAVEKDGENEADDDRTGIEQLGFVTLHALDPEDAAITWPFTFSNVEEDYPETWLDYDSVGRARFKSTYRQAQVKEISVAPDGSLGTGARAWFIPGRFRFCLRCGTTHSTSARDRTRLASLSAEGRSSATTVLVSSVLRWMHAHESGQPADRKLLGFTDNRQDAALQSGHFNDFLFVSLVRAAFLGALDAAGESGLRSDELGLAQQRALGFDRATPALRAEWLGNPTLKGIHVQEAEATLRQVLSYRVWFDQRRGWRYTNPNLEQLGLVEVEYIGLDELVADGPEFDSAPEVLRLASPAARKAVYIEVLDHLRKWMAIRSHVLDSTTLEQVVQKSHTQLRTPWGFSSDERPRPARWLLITPPSRKKTTMRDEDLIVRGGSRSTLGRILKSSRGSRTPDEPNGRVLWDDPAAARALKLKEVDELIAALLKAACSHGLVVEEVTPFADQVGFRLSDASVRFKRGRLEPGKSGSKEQRFFRDLYANLASTLRSPSHPLFGFEAREHTAQVDAEKRMLREKRFRFRQKEADELAADAKNLREIGESSRLLPVLFCSPTMEMGVDISTLSTVYLRNVPPTPANYAQRSGRAGRSGQPALVLTYSSSQSPHDQYFFRDPKGMVHGEVRPPMLDLANRNLVESHLSAVWLACTEQPLPASIADLLVLDTPNRDVKPEIVAPMSTPKVADEARRRIKRVLELLDDDLSNERAPWYPGPDAFAEEVVSSATERFGRSFYRWRELFRSAEQQRDAARRTMDHYAAPPQEKRAAEGRHKQAIDQLNLLQSDTKSPNSTSSDFNTYRYLATEGFLPGYNFPRLPLMAYIPATNDGRGRQTYLQRPRFLALSEFGPRSLVYHEGRAFRVVRAMLALGQGGPASADVRLPTETVRICKACGAGHWTDDASVCHACEASLGDAEIVNHTFRIENVSTRPAERITANDEERQRQGFELQTTFEWASRDNRPDRQRGTALDDDGDIVRLAYGPGATITRLNKGLRRRKDRTQLGFLMDPVSGHWATNDDDGDEPKDPTVSPRQWIVPRVRDSKNALLMQPSMVDLSQRALATVQHALLRGIEAECQLETGEILAEPMPQRDERTGFLLYEATEGGAGVLTRLVSEQGLLTQVARKALAIMHFDLTQGVPATPSELFDVANAACVAACYRCTMSYFNQPDHELLDRRDDDARSFLLRLARARLVLEDPVSPRRTQPPVPDEGGDIVDAWRAFVRDRQFPLPDSEPLVIDGQSIPLVWRTHYVAALFSANVTLARALENIGFELVILGESETSWSESSAKLAKLLGSAS